MELQPYTRNGTTVMVRDNTDRAVLAQVQTEYPWGELPTRLSTIVDVGAHAGYFTIEAKKHWPDARVLCVEPDISNVQALHQNVKQYGHIYVHRAYIWYSEGDYAFARHKVHSSGHVIVPASFKGDVYDVVPLDYKRLTLEELIEPYAATIDLLKLDCEGAEMDILTHVSDSMLSRIRCIVGERHGTLEQFGTIYARLRDAGFTVRDTVNAHNPKRGIFLAKREPLL